MDVDLTNFEKEDFAINGFFRALVEDNADPKSGGRVRVRILGIHSMDATVAPTENLPWAEPVLPLAHSGGAANQHVGPPKPSIPKTKYKPEPIDAPLKTQLPLPASSDTINKASAESTTIPIFKDSAICNSGTGGHFSVPAKGSLVWVFFDGGCHLRPQYFAMATQQRDWKAQSLKIFGEMLDRDASVAEITTLLSTPNCVDSAPHNFTGESTSLANAILTKLPPPKHIPQAPKFAPGAKKIENLSSWTSPGGTTILTDHTWDDEQFYIIHKGYSQHIDVNGNVTKVVGTTNNAPTNSKTGLNPKNTGGVSNDETEINAGLKNIYIVGDYNIFVNGNCNIQCAQKVTINALADVGVVSRTGNVSVLAEKGSINLESTTNSVNIKGVDISLEADNNITIKSKNKIDISSLLDIQIAAIKSLKTESASIQTNAITAFGIQSSSILMNSLGPAIYNSATMTTITSPAIQINGANSVFLSANSVQMIATKELNLESPDVNLLGGKIGVTASGIVSILGNSTNVYGTANATLGGALTTVGGITTILTGIVTLGIGAVVPPASAMPVSESPVPPTIIATPPLEPPPLITSHPGVDFPNQRLWSNIT